MGGDLFSAFAELYRVSENTLGYTHGIPRDTPYLYTWSSAPRRSDRRGHITHIPNGTRRYVQDLDGIVFFIIPYLESMGVRLGLHWRLKRWLNRARSHLLL